MVSKPIILHLCADIGSDSRYFQLDQSYEVIKVGKDIGVENFQPPEGVIANPVCTEFSIASGFDKKIVPDTSIVDHCTRIIHDCRPKWWVIENPASGRLKNYLGKPYATYEPWMYGTPWTKRTALWGSFRMPDPLYTRWEDVPKNPNLYVRPGRKKPSLAFLHKSAIQFTPEYDWCKDRIHCDADFRSLCSDGFARAFYEANAPI